MGNFFRLCNGNSDNDESNQIIVNQHDSDVPVECIHTVRINLSIVVSLLLMRVIYCRLGVPIGEIRVLTEGTNYTLFMMNSKELKNAILEELSKSEIKYID